MIKILFIFYITMIPCLSFAIPPDFIWVNQTAGVYPKDIAIDPDGNTIVLGSFNNEVKVGNNKLFAEKDGWFIAKYSDQNDCFIWCKQINFNKRVKSSNEEGLFTIATDTESNLIISGNLAGSFSYNNTIYTPKGDTDIIIIKFDKNGNVLWLKQLTSIYDTMLSSMYDRYICTDKKNNIVISGKFSRNIEIDGMVLNGFSQPPGEARNYDIFTAKFSPNGKLLWARQDGGTFPDWIYGITLDRNNNIIITGSFCGPATFGDTTFYTPSYKYKMFVSKYTSNGEPLWAKQWEGSGCSSGQAVEVDSENNIIVGGYAMTGAVVGDTQFIIYGHYDPIFVKYDPDGNILWTKHIRSVQTDYYSAGSPDRIMIDSNDNYIINGRLSGDYYFDNTKLDTKNKSFIINLNKNGNLNWFRTSSNVANRGLSRAIEIDGIALDNDNNIRVVGSFGCFGDKAIIDHITLTSYTDSDMFIGRLGQLEYSTPTPDFFAKPTEGELPLQVRFYDQSYGVVHDRKWDFDNNGTVDCTARDCTFTYTEPGAYSVKLTTSNDKGEAEKIMPYYIVAGKAYPPKADFEADITYGSAPLTVTFNDLSSYVPAQLEWDFNDDELVDCVDKECTYVFSQPGKYSVSLIAKNERGSDQEIKKDYISVGPPDLFFSNAQIHTDLKEREESKTIISIVNTGNSELEFSIELQDTTGPINDESPIIVQNKKSYVTKKSFEKPIIKGKYADNQIIVQLKNNVTDAEKEELIREMDVEIIEKFGYNIEMWTIPSGTVTDIIDKYYNNSKFNFIEPNYIKTINKLPDDPEFYKMWNFHSTGQDINKYYSALPDTDIDIPEAWDYMSEMNTNEVIIAVIDTGLDYNHEDLEDLLWENPGETGVDEHGNDKASNGIDDDGNGYIDDIHGWNWSGSGNEDNDPFDDHGHGTRISGIIGAKKNNQIGISGICPDVKIMALKAFDKYGGAMDYFTCKAMQYVVMMRQQYGVNVCIVNMSYGGYEFLEMEYTVLEQLKEAGILVVSAAGNEGNNVDIHPHYPSCYDFDNIISGAGTNFDNSIYLGSNYGKQSVDMGAPGNYIFSTNVDNKYNYYAGTSYSNAHISGVAGLLWSIHPGWNYKQIKQRIMKSVDPLYALKDKSLVNGKINAYNAVRGHTSWLSTKIHEATIKPNESINLEFTIHADYIESGEYNGNILFHTNIPLRSEIKLPVSITVEKNTLNLDINNDGKIDLHDVIFALQILAGTEKQSINNMKIELDTAIQLINKIGGK